MPGTDVARTLPSDHSVYFSKQYLHTVTAVMAFLPYQKTKTDIIKMQKKKLETKGKWFQA